MEIFKELNKKSYKHYYEGTVEELDSMDKDNQHLHSEIIQVIMWLYEKHGIWISVNREPESGVFFFSVDKDKGDFFYDKGCDFNSPTEAYEAAILFCLEKII